MTELEQWIADARQQGREAGRTAASWVLDGNTSLDHYHRIVDMIDAGDPALDTYLPQYPNLSGEWADSATPISLYEEITGKDHEEATEAAGLAYETLVGSVVDAIAQAWEEGVSDTFHEECERLLREAIG